LKFIAADVNKNNSITASDLSEIRKLILGRTNRFEKNTSWRFIQSNYKFIDPQDPFSEVWDQDFKVEKLDGNYYGNYTGIKVGDVDDSNKLNGLAGVSSRSGLKHRIFLTDVDILAGKEVEVEISLPSLNMDGVQAAFQIDPSMGRIIEYSIPDQSAFTLDHFGDKYLDRGVLLTSWNASHLNSYDLKVKLKIQLNKNAKLSEVLSLNSDLLTPEAYMSGMDPQKLLLEFNQGNNMSNGLKLFQNIPNPFTVGTIIPFEVSYDGNIKIYITDMTGNKVYSAQQYFTSGYHEIELSKKLFNKPGIYYYHLQTDRDNFYRRMILLD
jgi:hypothetical protein